MIDETHNTEFSGFLEHQEALQRLAHSLLAGRDGADDLLQDTWLVAQESGRETHTLSWLRGVLRNLVYKRRRGELRRKERELQFARNAEYELAESTLEIQGRVLETVRALPERYRVPMVLRYYNNLAPGEIARQLNEPVETIKTRLRRGLARMRAQLDDRDATFSLGWVTALAPIVKGASSTGLSHGALGVPNAGAGSGSSTTQVVSVSSLFLKVLGVSSMMKVVVGLAVAVTALLIYLSLPHDDPSAPRGGAHTAPNTVASNDKLPESTDRSPIASSPRIALARTDPSNDEILARLNAQDSEVLIEPVVQLHLSTFGGSPLPDEVRVQVTQFSSESAIPAHRVSARCRLTNGSAEIPLGFEGGKYGYTHGVVEVTAEGYGRQESELAEIGWDEGDVSRVTLVLSPCSTVDVLAVHEGSGLPVKDVRFVLKGPSSKFGMFFESKQGGVVSLNLLPPGEAEDLTHVTGAGVAMGSWTTDELMSLPTDNAGVRRLDFSRGCTLRGSIEMESGLPIPAGTEVRYVMRRNPGAGLMEYPHGMAPQGQVQITAEGTFEIHALPAGTLLLHLRKQSRDIRAPQIGPDYVATIPRGAEAELHMVVPAEPEVLTLNLSWGDTQVLFADIYRPADERDGPYANEAGIRKLIAQEHWFSAGSDTYLTLPPGTLNNGGTYILRIGQGVDRRIERTISFQGNAPRLQHAFTEAERAEYPQPNKQTTPSLTYTDDQRRAAREAGAQAHLEARTP